MSAPSFPLHQFLRKNFDEEAYGTVEQILETPAILRTEEQCTFLIDTLQNIDFFKKTTRALTLEIARVAAFLSTAKGDIVFKQGAVGTKFYVILKGSVSVRVQDMLKPDDKGFEAAVLIAGKAFGELALHAEGALRSATIIAIEECGFLTLDKMDYDRILKRALDSEMREKLDFCSELPFLASCSQREVQRLSSIMVKKKFDRDQMIFAQGDESANVYFVVSGEVRVVHYLELKYETAAQTEAKRLARIQKLTNTLAAATTNELGSPTSARSQAAAIEPTNAPSSASAEVSALPTTLPLSTAVVVHPPAPAASRRSPARTARRGAADPHAAAKAYFHASSMPRGNTSATSAATVTTTAKRPSVTVPPLALAKKAIAAPASARSASGSQTARSTSLSIASADRTSTALPVAAAPPTPAPASDAITARTFGGTGAVRPAGAPLRSARSATSSASATASAREIEAEASARRQRMLAAFHERTAPQRPQFELVDLGVLGPRSFFGEIGCLKECARTASVFAKTRVEVMVLSKGDFLTRMPPEALEYIRNFGKLYPSYDEILATLQQQQKWSAFKGSVLTDAMRLD